MIFNKSQFSVIFALNFYFMNKKTFKEFYFFLRQAKISTTILLNNFSMNLNSCPIVETTKLRSNKVRLFSKILESI